MSGDSNRLAYFDRLFRDEATPRRELRNLYLPLMETSYSDSRQKLGRSYCSRAARLHLIEKALRQLSTEHRPGEQFSEFALQSRVGKHIYIYTRIGIFST